MMAQYTTRHDEQFGIPELLKLIDDEAHWYLLKDGASLCGACTSEERGLVLEAMSRPDFNDQWRVIGQLAEEDVSEDGCAHCYRPTPAKEAEIEAALESLRTAAGHGGRNG